MVVAAFTQKESLPQIYTVFLLMAVSATLPDSNHAKELQDLSMIDYEAVYE